MARKAAGTAPAAGSSESAAEGAAAPALDSANVAQAGAQDAGKADEQAGASDTGNTQDVVQAGASAPAEVVIEPLAPSFPRLVAIVNDTPIPYVIAGLEVAGHESLSVAVNDQDEITRMESDCKQIMSLNDTHKDRDEPALRVTEVE